MSDARVLLVANTWTDLSAYGPDFILRAKAEDVELGLKATAPTAVGKTVTAGSSAKVIIGQGTLKPWARIVAGGYVEIDQEVPFVLVEPTTATA